MAKKVDSKGPPKKLVDDGSGISAPYNVQVKLTVDTNLNWDASSPDDVFTIKSQIGKGAYGIVYKAEFKASAYVIAAKRVVEDEKGKSTIKKEVDILKKCNHPNIVNYFGCLIGKDPKDLEKGGFKYPDAEEKSLWILMDYCGGGSVKDYMEAKGALNENQAAAVLIGVLQGLVYLHAQTPKIIHRDLKAANILMTMDGGIKIADFGISTQLSATVTGNAKTMIGTTYWMAPEILTEHYNHKIDIWSLGITAAELVETTPPNYNLKPFQMMLKLPKDPPPTLKNPEKYSKEFNDFISRCLQKDIEKRPEAKDLLGHPFILNHISTGAKAVTDLIVAMAKRA